MRVTNNCCSSGGGGDGGGGISPWGAMAKLDAVTLCDDAAAAGPSFHGKTKEVNKWRWTRRRSGPSRNNDSALLLDISDSDNNAISRAFCGCIITSAIQAELVGNARKTPNRPSVTLNRSGKFSDRVEN